MSNEVGSYQHFGHQPGDPPVPVVSSWMATEWTYVHSSDVVYVLYFDGEEYSWMCIGYPRSCHDGVGEGRGFLHRHKALADIRRFHEEQIAAAADRKEVA